MTLSDDDKKEIVCIIKMQDAKKNYDEWLRDLEKQNSKNEIVFPSDFPLIVACVFVTGFIIGMFVASRFVA